MMAASAQPAALALCLCVLAGLPAPCWAEPGTAFLEPPPSLEQRRASLTADLHEALSSGRRRAPTETDLSRLEEVLEPIFLALPRDSRGALGAAGARYALHRAFLQLHGWRVKGLDAAGGAWTELAPATALGGEMPDDLGRLFEERLARGVDLHELSALAAAIEHLIHRESEGRLRALYASLELPVEGRLGNASVTRVVDAYVASFALGVATAKIKPASLRTLMSKIHRAFPAWPAARVFARELQDAKLPAGGAGFTFEDVEAVVEEFSQRFGRWQNSDCLEVKEDLVKLEELKGGGRVRLSDFYHATLHHGKWFNESPEFLRMQGALDDAELEAPRVVIPNYVYSPANCIANMQYYSVCCIDECEDLIGHLEGHFRAPSAEPEAIAAAVAALPSSSKPAGRTLPPKLVARLEEIAAEHGGQVALHGRLFAQWMHHAYPRECPYPHVSGTTTPRTAKEFAKQMGRTHKASPEEMRRHVGEARAAGVVPATDNGCGDEDDEEAVCSALPWEAQEELVDAHAHHAAAKRRTAGPMLTLLRTLVFLAALCSATLGLVRVATSLRPEGKSGAAPVVHFV